MAIFFCFIFDSAFGQFYNGSQTNFGKSRVQYNDYIWLNYKFEKFDTYFYLGGKSLAIYTAKVAEKNINDIEKRLDVVFDKKIQFIIFNKHSDLKESNIGSVSEDQYNIGGTTTILGSKVILFFNGNYADFEKQIRMGITQVILNQILYGENITSKIKNSTLLSLPDWYVQGLAAYIAIGWNTEIDNIVRDGITSRRYKKFNHLTGKDAINAGHSFWYFLAEKYGEPMIPNVLYMARLSRNLESGFLYVLGISYKTIIKDWFNFYNNRYAGTTFEQAIPANQLKLKYKNAERVYGQIKISPDGQYIAYTSNELGQKKVWIHNLTTGKTKRILKYNYKLDENPDQIYPLLTWHPSSKILLIMRQIKGSNYIFLYTLETKKLEKRLFHNLELVTSMNYAPDGRSLVLAGTMQNESDIYVYNMASRTLETITKDNFDDYDPYFINNGSYIAFCSNRKSDTIEINKSAPPEELDKQTDLFLYNYNSKSNVLMRISNTPLANETKPWSYAFQNIAYLSDENGIRNKYLAQIDSVIAFIDTTTHYKFISSSQPITNYAQGILEQSITETGKKQADLVLSNGRKKLFVNHLVPVDSLEFLKLKPTSYKIKLLREASKRKEQKDSTQTRTEQSIKSKKLANVMIDDVPKKDTAKIDILNYEFDSSKRKPKQVSDTARKKIQNPIVKKDTSSPVLRLPNLSNTYIEYSINQLVTQFDYSFLESTYQPFSGGKTPIYTNPSFSGLFKIGLTDLFEDRRIVGGFRLSGTLDNNEYLLSFENLKHRIDKSITFHRMGYNSYVGYVTIKHHTHEFYYRLSYPFDEVISVRGTAIYRNDRAVFLSTDMQSLKQPHVYKNWGGIKGEFVYDNSRFRALNIYYGTKFKVFAEHYRQLEEKNTGLSVVGFDARYYHKINKNLIWANRLAGSTSFGKQKLIYYLGGVDNWLFPKFDSITHVADDQNYAYQTVATNMRGFAQNIRNGNSFAVINSEIRFPVFNYFLNKPVKSDFINNFQIIGFTDIGTAWTGNNPYSDKNSLYKEVIIQNPIKVTIITQKEPIVSSFGCGLRSRVLGYFIRADLAWGIEDQILYKPMFHFSLSLDF